MMVNKRSLWLLVPVCLSVWLVACGSGENTTSVQQTELNASELLKLENLPENAPALGTDVADLVKTPQQKLVEKEADAEAEGVVNLRWEDLIPAGHEPEKILMKYREQIEAIPEGDPAERALLEKIQEEMNAAPVNSALQGKKVKLPGFVSPLDEKDGNVAEFLLVPYFGACIHVPPPPLNQTLLIEPQPDKSIPLDKIYEPVWVTGVMIAETVSTDLAPAGYVIKDAEVTPYEGKVGADY